MTEANPSIAGQLVVVTGATRGLGPALVTEFARLGATVVAVDVSGEEDGTAAAEASEGSQPVLQIDITNPFSVARMARDVAEQYGTPHLLINSALVCPVASVVDMEPEQWDRVMTANLRGPFLVCRAFLPLMLRRGSGTVVNVVPADPLPFTSAYFASGQGLAGFTRSLAAEVGNRGLQVLAFAPGLVDTPELHDTADELGPRLGLSPEQFLAATITAEKAAQAAAHLVLGFASQYHGQVAEAHAILERVSGEPIQAPTPSLPPDRRTPEEVLRDAQRLTARLQAIVDYTGTELSRLPFLVRPLARREFRRCTGRDLGYWSRALADLQGHLRQMDRLAHVGTAAFRAEHAQLADDLRRLQEYYEEAPEEFTRYTRDQSALRHVAERSAERVQVIEALTALLERLRS